MARLVVFDNSGALRDFLRLHLETAGHQVAVAEDAVAAERAVLSGNPDLVVASSGREGFEGLTLFARLRANPGVAEVPFILVGPGLEAAAAAPEQGVTYLPLPVTREALLHAVVMQVPGTREAGGSPAKADPRITDLQGVRRSMTRSAFLQAVNGKSDTGADTLPPMQDGSGSDQRRAAQSRAELVDEALPGSDSEPDVMSTQWIGNLRVDGGGQPWQAPIGYPGQTQPHAPSALGASASQEARSGTVLFADIRNFSALAEMLTTQELASLLNSYFVRACEPILQQGGWIVKLLGDGIFAMFEDLGHGPSHAERALKAALFLCIVAQRFGEWLDRRFPEHELPDFAIGVGVHTGDVMVCRINTGAGIDSTIIGDTVNVASRLEEQTKRLGASVVTSLDTLALAGARFIPGKRGSLLVRGRAAPVEITEVVGLRPRPNVDAHGLGTYSVIHEAVAHNSQIILHDRDRVLAEPHRIRNSGQHLPLRPADAPVTIPGFRLIRRLGQGGMSRAFLAEYETTGSLRVIKVLNVAEGGFDLLRRFLQEYELLSQIRHPNLATIFDRGQTETHGYIVMEYFPGGDLRGQVDQPMEPQRALDCLRQICEALVAVHARGIVHRDLKPDNVMLREDGSVALTDFGIAKVLSSTHSQTRHGEALGTPYYLSPEQAVGGKVDQRSDLYSLGAMFFEMLTGDKPYYAEDAPSLLHRHVHDPVPALPVELALYQPLLDRLMAKKPEDRFPGSQEALRAINALLHA